MSRVSHADIYPLTIISDRYNGAYSGAKFLAFALDHCDIPEEVGGGDGDEMRFWDGDLHKRFKIGKGSTPQEAFNDLWLKLQ
jgi:hypothetical protein